MIVQKQALHPFLSPIGSGCFKPVYYTENYRGGCSLLLGVSWRKYHALRFHLIYLTHSKSYLFRWFCYLLAQRAACAQ